jgi:hypothetical protein
MWAMTERSASKSRRADEPKAARKTVASQGANAEVVRLTSELAAATARIAELEQRQIDVINRIEWVIDSLHNLSRGK